MVYEEEIGSIKGHIGPLQLAALIGCGVVWPRNALAWFRDGAGFVTGGEDGYVRVHHFDKDYFTAKRFE